MTRGRPPGGTKFAPLLDYLAAQREERVTLTFAQIEEMIGGPLPNTAYGTSAYWTAGRASLGQRLTVAGWRARLNIKAHSVTFARIGAAYGVTE